MILTENKPNIESSANFEEKFFSIQDQSMIIDLMRTKLYSNPTAAVCREYACNALDSHREAGKVKMPIQISLPTNLSPNYKIKDFGVGISPDRMENVFIKYTASTKRNTNELIGGLGLGCKSAWSVSDSFSVETIFNGVKYSYLCYIDETKLGKLALLNTISTDECNGTEISIPVKNTDFQLFRQYTELACRHWDVKPIIKGADPIEWIEIKKIIEGKNWGIANSSDYYRNAKLVIDGIEYPLELDALNKYANTKLIDAARGQFIMYFNTGELSLSANREQIYLDKQTQDKIKDRLNDIQNEIKAIVDAKINAFLNLWDANVYYRRELNSAFHDLSFLGKLSWKNHTLKNGYVDTKCTVFLYQKGKYSYRKNYDPNKIVRSSSQHLEFAENCSLFINDLNIKEPTAKHIKKAFEDPKVKCVQVIATNDKQTEAELNKLIHLDEMNAKPLSSITAALPTRISKQSSIKLLVFKFSEGLFRQVSQADMKADKNTKVLCLLGKDEYNGHRFPFYNEKNLLVNVVKYFATRNKDISFYGVDKIIDPKRVNKEFSSFKTFETFVDDEFKNNNFIEMKHSRNMLYNLDGRCSNIEPFKKFIKNKDGLFFKRAMLSKTIKELADKKDLLQLFESVKGELTEVEINKFIKDNPDWDYYSLNARVNKKYPLLSAINSYDFDRLAEHISNYINLIDKESI